MTGLPELLPCNCPTADSLFTRRGGGRVLIVHPAVREPTIPINIPAVVWCATGHGWIDVTDAQAAALKVVDYEI